MTETERIKKAKAEYARRYRREHPEKVKAAQEKYWLKKSQVKESEAIDSGEHETGC